MLHLVGNGDQKKFTKNPRLSFNANQNPQANSNRSFLESKQSNKRATKVFDISFNKLSKSLPDGIAAMTNLVGLELRSNHLRGPLPYELPKGPCRSKNTILIFDIYYT